MSDGRYQREDVPHGVASAQITGYLDRMERRVSAAMDVQADNFYRDPITVVDVNDVPAGGSYTIPDRSGIYVFNPPDITGYQVSMPANPQPGDWVRVVCGAFQVFLQPFSLDGVTTATYAMGLGQDVQLWYDPVGATWRRPVWPKDYLSYYPQASGAVAPGGRAWLATFAASAAAQGDRTSGGTPLLPKLEASAGVQNSIWRPVNRAPQGLDDAYRLAVSGMLEDLTSATVKTVTLTWYQGLDIGMTIAIPFRTIWKGQTSGILGAVGERSFSNVQSPREDAIGTFYYGIDVLSDPGNVGTLQVKDVNAVIDYTHRI